MFSVSEQAISFISIPLHHGPVGGMKHGRADSCSQCESHYSPSSCSHDGLCCRCPPCRAFTPTLVQLYKKLNANKTPFEIVFVSSDKLEAEFAVRSPPVPGSNPWLRPNVY